MTAMVLDHSAPVHVDLPRALDGTPEETQDLHYALPRAPEPTPEDMVYCTLRIRTGHRRRDSHTFVGPPTLVVVWLRRMRSEHGLHRETAFTIVFRETSTYTWGETIYADSAFIAGRCYDIEACPPPPEGSRQHGGPQCQHLLASYEREGRHGRQ